MSERLPQSMDNLNTIAIVFQRPTKTDISQWEPLQTIDYLHKIMGQMPEDKTGLVLGSGPNTLEWKNRGWLTLDINPFYQTDFIINANNLESFFQNELDFILVENITFNPIGQYGISPDYLLVQAKKALKDNAHLIIKSKHIENTSSSLPNRYEYPQLMSAHGFKTIVEVNNPQNLNNGGQSVIYYGQKIN